MRIAEVVAALLVLFPPLSAAATAAQPQLDSARCLRGVKDGLQDPRSSLASWTFDSTSARQVCGLTGVTCWNDADSRIIDLRLPSMGLVGPIPSDLRFCSSVTDLEMPGNELSGQIPAALCDWLPYLVTLDLSSNKLEGPLPRELSNCRFLNELVLSGNRLSGTIPPEIGGLNRLKKFSVADNALTGLIPTGLSSFDSSSFDGNKGLCGRPLGRCGGGLSRTSLIIIIAAGVFGAAASLLLAYAVWRWCFLVSGGGKGGDGSPEDGDESIGAEGRQWVRCLRPHRLEHVSLFHKPIVKVKLADLLSATNEFDFAHVISSGPSGTAYRAVLRDGSALSVKRLNGCELQEKTFRAEVTKLGLLRHPNLVPLLGFCAVEDERLLIYKHMSGGPLVSILHSDDAIGQFDWPARLRIGIGAARGLAWLHHGVQPPLIHQRFCSAVVLLDEDHEARITDFGVAKLVRRSGDSAAKTSAFVDGDLGEVGYVAPEYSSTMVASLKGDVYAFGVVLLELVTGRKPLDAIDGATEEGFKGRMVDWVNDLNGKGRLIEAVDVSLRNKGREDEIMEFLKVAFGCVVARPKDRSSMYQVYQSLKAIWEKHEPSDQFDEYPLLFGKDEPGTL